MADHDSFARPGRASEDLSEAGFRRVLQPYDEFNRRLESEVHPPDWKNPVPAGRYNLVVIGAGTAGLVAAAGAAGVGAKVALVERGLMGGDCLNVGCVPSKALLSAARAASLVRRADEFGVKVSGLQVDFPAVMARLRRLRASISPHDSARRFRELGVDVFFGQTRFLDSSHLDVEGTRLAFRRAVIATGSRPAPPPIPGLELVPFHTNESLFSLTELPARMAVLGAGPIGCEMAQAFAQLGSQVLLIETEHGVLPREERDCAQIVQRSLERDGVRLLCCGRDLKIRQDRGICLTLESHGHPVDERVGLLLVATGRRPNVEQLDLERVGVAWDRQGVQVDDRLRTTNPRIYAAGDICTRYQFTHAADFMARAVVQNALFKGRKKFSRLTIPWCTYTQPELAHVGRYPAEPGREQEASEALDSYTQPLEAVDRAILEGVEPGLARIHVRRGTDRIRGATIVAPHAGDLISEVTLAMTNRLGLSDLGRTIHPYPTQAEALRRLGDQYQRTRLTPLVKTLFSQWLSWTR